MTDSQLSNTLSGRTGQELVQGALRLARWDKRDKRVPNKVGAGGPDVYYKLLGKLCSPDDRLIFCM